MIQLSIPNEFKKFSEKWMNTNRKVCIFHVNTCKVVFFLNKIQNSCKIFLFEMFKMNLIQILSNSTHFFSSSENVISCGILNCTGL